MSKIETITKNYMMACLYTHKMERLAEDFFDMFRKTRPDKAPEGFYVGIDWYDSSEYNVYIRTVECTSPSNIMTQKIPISTKILLNKHLWKPYFKSF